MTRKGDVIVLSYAGDFEASVAVPWLADRYGADVVTLTLDLGQAADLNDVRDRALAIGAVRAHVLDVHEEFARSAVVPALALGADRPRVASLARRLVAAHLIRVAAIEGASMVAHGGHRPASDPESLDATIANTAGTLRVIAPCRDWGLSRAAIIDYAQTYGIPVPAGGEALTAVRTLWGRALAGAPLDDTWTEVPAEAFTLTRSVEDWPKMPATLEVEFTDGAPTSLNGVPMPLPELLASLETIVGAHGVGRLDFSAIEGERPRIVEEAPAPVALHLAMKALGSVKPQAWPAVRGRVRMICFMGECRVEEASYV